MSKPGAPAGGSSTETVKVMVRCRPMNTKEKTKGKYTSHINYLMILKTAFKMMPLYNYKKLFHSKD